jgi:heptosyltransferase I
VSPGAGWGAKEWSPQKYGELAKRFAEEDISTLINFGPGEEDLAATVESASEGKAKPIACTMAQMIALIRRAALFVGGDTGPLHLANLLGVPVMALFGPTDPERNGPYFSPSTVLRDGKSRSSYSHTNTADNGLISITVEQAFAAAQELLAKR